MLKGTNFGPFEDEFLKKLPRNSNIWDFQATLTTKRHKNGSVVWFTFHFDPDLKNRLGLDQDTVDGIGAIADASAPKMNMWNGLISPHWPIRHWIEALLMPSKVPLKTIWWITQLNARTGNFGSGSHVK